MALDGFTIGGAKETAAPAKASGALSGFTIGSTAAKAAPVAAPTVSVDALVAKTPAPVIPKTETLFSKIKDFLTPKPSTPNLPGIKPKTSGPMVFPVGEGLNEKQKAEAETTVKKVAAGGSSEKYDANVIKLPFAKAGVDLNQERFFQENPLLTGILKGFVELPERAVRTLGEGVGLAKPIEGNYAIYSNKGRGEKPTLFQVPSYAEAAGKTTGELIDQGVPPAAAVILSSAVHGGDFANNALLYEGLLEVGASAALRGLKVPTESQMVAYDFLGRPKTMAEAETNFRAIQREFHPDKAGSAGQTVSAKANDAISTLRTSGIPSTNKIKEGINAILNKPVSELFGSAEKVPAGYSPKMTIKGFLEEQNKVHEGSAMLKTEVNDAIISHGEDLTRQALAKNLGLDTLQADRVIAQTKAESILADPAAAAKTTLQLSAPGSAIQIEAPKALKGFTITKTAQEVALEEKVIQSIREKGGVTINVNGAEPSKGFSYAPKKDSEFSVPEKDFHANPEKYYDDFYEKNKDLLADPENHIGGWVDGGRVYLDVSRVGDASAETIAKAQEAQQLGVYDLEHGKTITTGQLAEDGTGVYTPIDEAANVYDKHQREISGSSKEGGTGGSEKIQPDKTGGGEAPEKLKPVGGGEKVASELASGIEARAIEKKLTDKPFASLSTHERAVMSDQREAATKLYADDAEKAQRIALGEENAPEGMLSSVIYQKVVSEAEKAGDIDLIMRLATSPYNDEITAMAQQLRGLAEFRDKESPTEIIKQVVKARKTKVETKAKTKPKVIERAQKQIAKRTPKIVLKDVQEFINLLEC